MLQVVCDACGEKHEGLLKVTRIELTIYETQGEIAGSISLEGHACPNDACRLKAKRILFERALVTRITLVKSR